MTLAFQTPAAVRLLPGDFDHAQRVNLEALLRLDPDRLLAPFRSEAGLAAVAEAYGGWEASGLGGHTAGHVLSALALAIPSTGDPRAVRMLERLLIGLHEAQIAGGTGYLGGVSSGVELWEELMGGTIDASPFELNGRWVPLYNLHKTVAGLIDVAEHLPGRLADQLLDGFGEWWLHTCAQLDQEALERILVTEFGGLTESFARLALLRHDERYLRLAVRFAHSELLGRLERLGDDDADRLAGLHANTQIPVVVGYATIERTARALDARDEDILRIGTAARAFFDEVAYRHSTAIGGHGVKEHFHSRDDFGPLFLAREGPESCNTYNMVKLAAELYLLTEDPKYLDFLEVAQCSHVLSTQHPGHGGLVYFTSHRPGHYRVYSPEQDGFWCCMGSGFEAHARHGAHVYATTGDELRVAWLLASELRWEEFGVVVRIDSGWPGGGGAQLRVEAAEPATFTLAVRIPPWAAGAEACLTDGTAVDDDGAGWWRVRRTWTGTEVMSLSLGRTVQAVPAPDGSRWAWLQHGPTVLAQVIPDRTLGYRATSARTAHIASGPLRPLAEMPVIDTSRLEAQALEGGSVAIRAADGTRLELKPLHRIHDSRYRISWPISRGHHAAAEVRSRLEDLDRACTGLEARVVDGVAFGEQQPESDHEVVAPGAERGTTEDGLKWLRPAGSLSLVLRDWEAVAKSLRLEWLPDDDGEPAFLLGRDAVVALDGATTWEVPLTADGEAETRITLAAVDGRPMPRLRRILLLTDAADTPVPAP
ncbi:glycoside hydrolase family 127 protein [Sinomonas sp. JGH33]|uniref:Glycoside hydrolase family 127 protein n=1 Tax=Sinomonas terricola TaxID=3110330 RepID=A0ABU5T6E7_9MICC|nr:beta-L-arabinofuranosidase domain-containing protein [Sinomonas sp. JGH33]MEA5455242.1 glycoside hydrolase family 127 protein [Sinomonas sp. JGH33]